MECNKLVGLISNITNKDYQSIKNIYTDELDFRSDYDNLQPFLLEMIGPINNLIQELFSESGENHSQRVSENQYISVIDHDSYDKGFVFKIYKDNLSHSNKLELRFREDIINYTLLNRRGIEDINNYVSNNSQLNTNIKIYLDNLLYSILGEEVDHLNLTDEQKEKLEELEKELNYENINSLINNPVPASRMKLQKLDSLFIYKNIDNILKSIYGNQIAIKSFGRHIDNKYSFSGESNLGSGFSNEDISVEDQASNVIKGLVETINKYNISDNRISDKKMAFKEFNSTIGFIKSLYKYGNINLSHIKENLGLSRKSGELLLKYGDYLVPMINHARINPQEMYPAIFEILSKLSSLSKYELNKLVNNPSNISHNTNLNGFLKEFHIGIRKNIQSIYNDFFDLANEKSVLSLSIEEGRTKLIEYITEYMDTIFPITNIYYHYDSEKKTFSIKELKDLEIERKIREIKEVAENQNNSKFNTNYNYEGGDIENGFSSNDNDGFKRILTFTERSVNNKNIPDVNNSIFKVEILDDFGNTINFEKFNDKLKIKYIKSILNIDLDKNIELRYVLSDLDEGYINALFNYAKEIDRVSYLNFVRYKTNYYAALVYDETAENDNQLSDDQDNEEDVKEQKIPIVYIDDTKHYSTLLNLATAYSIINGTSSDNTVKNSEGKAQAGMSMSRLLQSLRFQFLEQNKRENSATAHFELVNNALFLRDILSFKEVKGQTEVKANTDLSIEELFYSIFEIDYLEGFDSHTLFTPSINSDKKEVEKLKVNLNILFKGINGNNVSFNEANYDELLHHVKHQMGSFYKTLLENVASDYKRFFDFLLEERIEQKDLEKSLIINQKDLEKSLMLYDMTYINGLLKEFGINSYSELLIRINNYNKVNPDNLFQMHELMHYGKIHEKDGELILTQNESSLALYARFDLGLGQDYIEDKEFYEKYNELKKEHTLDSFEEYMENKFSELIDDLVDLKLITLNDNKKIKQLKKFNLLDYYISESFMISTVGTHQGHSGKGSTYLEIEAARNNGRNKRNVMFTALKSLVGLNFIDGVSSKMKFAVLEDEKDRIYTINGESEEGSAYKATPYDGAVFTDPFLPYLINNSLGSNSVGMVQKPFIHLHNEKYGLGGIVKTATFPITNDLMRNSYQFRRYMLKLTNIKFTDDINIFNSIDGRKINENSLVFYKNENGDIILLTNAEYIGGNQYNITTRNIATNEIKIETKYIESVYDIWQLYGGYRSGSYDAQTGEFEYNENSIINTLNHINRTGSKKEGVETPLLASDVNQPLKKSYLNMIVTEGAMKSGAANKNPKSAYYDNSELSYMEMEAFEFGIQLDKEHSTEHSDVSLFTQVISALTSRGYTNNRAKNVYSALSKIADRSSKEFFSLFDDFFRTDINDEDYEEKKNEFHKLMKWSFLKSLLKQGVNDANFASVVAHTMKEEIESGNIDNVPLAFSDPDVYNKFISYLNSFLTKSGVRLKFQGVLAVLNPSYEIYKMYNDKKLELFENYDALEKELKKIEIEQSIDDVSKIKFDRVYEIVKYDENGNEELRFRRFIRTPKDYFELKKELKDVYSYKMFEYILPDEELNINGGRNLGAYNVYFSDLTGKTYNLFDLNSIQALFTINDIKAEDLYDAINNGTLNNFYDEKNINSYLQDIINGFLTNNNHLSFVDNDPKRTKDNLMILIHRMKLQDLFSLSREYPNDSVFINGEPIKVNKDSIEIEQPEIVMSKKYKEQFSLKVGDLISDILEDPDFFFKRFIENQKRTRVTNYDIELRTLSGDVVYIKRGKENTQGLTLLKSELGRKDTGELYYIDESGTKKIAISSELDIIAEQDGHKVIITDNVDFYLRNTPYQLVLFNPEKYEEEGTIYEFVDKISSEGQDLGSNFKRIYKSIKDNVIEDSSEEALFHDLYKYILDKDENYNEALELKFLDRIKLEFRKTHTSFLEHLNIVAARIPSQSMQSFMGMKIVAFDNLDVNNAYVSTLQIFLQGSDYDIDALTILMYNIDKSGSLETWNRYASYINKEALQESMLAPLPTGESVKEKLIDKEVDNNYYEEIWMKLSEAGMIVLKTRKTKKGNIETFNTIKLHNLTRSQIKVLNSIINEVNKNGLAKKVEDDSLLYNEIKKMINDYNTYLDDIPFYKFKIIMENYIMKNLHYIITDAVNQEQAHMSVDKTVDPFKKRGNENESQVKKAKKMQPGKFIDRIYQFTDNQAGAKGIGIAASALKAFFASTFSFNSILNNEVFNEREFKMLEFNKEINNKTYSYFANIRPLFLEQSKSSIDNNENLSEDQKEHFKSIIDELVSNLDYDTALALSALLSLATDNAKELQLGKLNAGTDTLSIYAYALSIGMPFNEVADILMDDFIVDVVNQIKGNIFKNQTNTYLSLKVDELLNGNPTNDEKDKLNTLKSLINGASEMTELSQILSLNQGLKNKEEEMINFIKNFEEIILSAKRRKGEDDKKYSKEELHVDAYKFAIDEEYRQQKIDVYEEYKDTLNILLILSKSPLFLQYFKNQAAAHQTLMTTSLKYRTGFSFVDNLSTVMGAFSKKDKQQISKGIKKFVQADIRDKFFVDQGIKIILGKDSVTYTPSGGIIKLDNPKEITLGSPINNAAFKTFFETEVVPMLKLIYSTNNFILSLGLKTYTLTNNKEKTPVISININMSPRSPIQQELLNKMIIHFNNLAGKTVDLHGKTYNVIDLFFLYNLITFNNSTNEASFKSIFKNQYDKNELIKKFITFSSKMDSDFSYELGKNVVTNEIIPFVITMSSSKFANRKSRRLVIVKGNGTNGRPIYMEKEKQTNPEDETVSYIYKNKGHQRFNKSVFPELIETNPRFIKFEKELTEKRNGQEEPKYKELDYKLNLENPEDQQIVSLLRIKNIENYYSIELDGAAINHGNITALKFGLFGIKDRIIVDDKVIEQIEENNNYFETKKGAIEKIKEEILQNKTFEPVIYREEFEDEKGEIKYRYRKITSHNIKGTLNLDSPIILNVSENSSISDQILEIFETIKLQNLDKVCQNA